MPFSTQKSLYFSKNKEYESKVHTNISGFGGIAVSLNKPESETVSRSVVSDSATLWTVAHQVPLSKEFSRQGHWSGLPFPSPGDLSNPGIMPRYPAPWTDSSLFEPLETLRENSMELQADSLPSEPPEMLRENSYGSSLKTTITI